MNSILNLHANCSNDGYFLRDFVMNLTLSKCLPEWDKDIPAVLVAVLFHKCHYLLPIDLSILVATLKHVSLYAL